MELGVCTVVRRRQDANRRLRREKLSSAEQTSDLHSSVAVRNAGGRSPLCQIGIAISLDGQVDAEVRILTKGLLLRYYKRIFFLG